MKTQKYYTDEQKELLPIKTPPVFSSVYADTKGIVYSSTTYTKEYAFIQKHNTAGQNQFTKYDLYAELDMIDLCTDYEGMVYAVSKTGYIYVDIPEELLQLQTNSANDDIEDLLSKYINCVKENNAIVLPIQIGYSSQENKNLLYQHLDILICTLLKNGYEFVTINKI